MNLRALALKIDEIKTINNKPLEKPILVAFYHKNHLVMQHACHPRIIRGTVVFVVDPIVIEPAMSSDENNCLLARANYGRWEDEL